MTNVEIHVARWRKSSHSSGGEGQCVEVAALPAGRMVGMRDSKDPEGPVLSLTPAEWSTFLNHVRQTNHARHVRR